MDKINLMKEIREFIGIWYLPEKQDNPVSGILHYNKKKKIRLELIGSLSHEDNPIKNFFNDESDYQQIIYGESSDGKKITLVDCFKGPQSLNFSSRVPLTSFDCQFIIVGTQLSNKEESCFNRIKVIIPILSQWLYPALIEKKIYFENDKPTKFELNIPCEQKILKVELNADFDLLLKSECKYKESGIAEDLQVKQYTFFEIESKNGNIAFPEFLDKAYLFIHFLTLASLTAQNPSEIYLFNNDDFQSHNDNKYFNATEILFINRNENLPEGKLIFLFKYKKIENEFPEIINKWYSFSKDLAPIKNHLLNSIQQKPVFTSLDFLIVVQALEGYHTRFVDFQKKGRVTLKDRLEDLIRIFSSDVQKIKNSKVDIQAIVDTRDYFSHFFKRNTKPNLVEGFELFDLTKELRLLLTCCVLNLIGFSKQKINELLKNNTNL